MICDECIHKKVCWLGLTVVQAENNECGQFIHKKELETRKRKKPCYSFEQYSCPNCYRQFAKKNSQANRYCSNCGQALDWSDIK